MFLIDTNVLAETRKQGDGKADRNVVAWLSQVDGGDLFLSCVTLMEVELGILRMERRDAVQGSRLRTWMDRRVLPEFINRVIPVDVVVALRCADLHVPNPRPERDALIAATALVHGMTVVTRNTDDFETTGARLINPWHAS